MRWLFIACLFCSSCLQYIDPIDQHTLKKDGTIKVYSRGGEAAPGFLEDVDRYAKELLTSIWCPTDKLDEVAVVITHDHGNLVGVYWPFVTIEVVERTPTGEFYDQQLSAFGHELVRWACWRELDCNWNADDAVWATAGPIGEYWTAAENLSLLYLGSSNTPGIGL